MGELGGFLKIERVGVAYEDPAERVAQRALPRVPGPALRRGAGGAGRALHGVRRAVLPQRLPAGQPDPRLERPRLPRSLAGRDPPAARDQQLPRVHRPAVPGAVRGGVRARDPRGRRGHDQADRELDHRPRLGRGLGPARSRRARETGRSVAVIGAGPAGMAAAQQLRRAGHRVVLFERDEAAGGLCRFGVPDFKIEKRVVERRVQQLVAEGVELRCGVDVGVDITGRRAARRSSTRSSGHRLARAARPAGPGPRARRRPLRDGLPLRAQPLGRERRRAAAERRSPPRASTSIVIGGGDTGADCVGNSIREGARRSPSSSCCPSRPPARPDDRTPWPLWPQKFRLSYAMEEAQALGRGEQDFSIVTTRFEGEDGRVARLHHAQAAAGAAVRPGRRHRGRELDADLVLLAMGFLHPEHEGLVDQLGVDRDAARQRARPRPTRRRSPASSRPATPAAASR